MVKPITTVTVTPKIPKALARLEDLALNMRFTWDHEAIALFRRMDPEAWEKSHHNPVAMLGMIPQERFEEFKNDPAFMSTYERVVHAFDEYLNSTDTWFDHKYGQLDPKPVIAYFSMEFGLGESLPNYSGGLGVLSGDHLKSSSGLHVPLVGVGLLYQEGYFQQYLNADGWQQELYPINDFANMPLKLERDKDGNPLKIDVQLPGRKLYAQIWRVQVGRTPLFLLDSNIPDNPREDDRSLTDRLYGGDRRTRIRQEILLGIGGVRALAALGIDPTVVHLNEGHSAFGLLERIRMKMAKFGLTFQQAQEIVAASTVFTLHTPVPAGLERFGYDLIDEHFTEYARELGLTREQFHDLGREDMGGYDLFSMSVMALKMSYGANGVAQLHGDVSREMWNWMYPRLPEHEVPIGAVTNGIHVLTWLSREMATLYDRYLDPNWRKRDFQKEMWQGVENIPDSELWRTHTRRRERLVSFCRERLKAQLIHRGASSAEIEAADEVLNPDALTIGFARRFATYKRATLIFRDLDRLDKLVNNPDRPVQFIFAGKAHPHDNEGKAFIREIVRVANMPQFRHSIVFLENYDMNIARYLVQGCDVWLNNPRRPKEASGTSGMKAIYNGCLNFSILDGWWAEAYNPEVGWAIGNGEQYPESQADVQDRIESEALMNVLERDIIPKFYNQGRDGLPREWITMMKNAIKQLGHFFTTHRMVQEYTEKYYLPAHQRYVKMTTPKIDAALPYVNWRINLPRVWNEVRVLDVSVAERHVKVGSKSEVTATVYLGALKPEEVRVQLYCGPLDTRGEIIHGEATDMQLSHNGEAGTYIFTAQHKYSTTGEQGLSVRVVPYNELMSTPFQPGLITWAG
ncbi:MAG: alpha-glucan family phosphorylase [Anaerolineae bacterium]